LPVATQWEIVEEAAELLKPARNESIRHVAQGEVVHNDDTSMRVLRLAREPSDERTSRDYRVDRSDQRASLVEQLRANRSQRARCSHQSQQRACRNFN
jgi:predicted transcriptional regulator